MSKWELTDAAIKRIEVRLAENNFGIDDHDAWSALLLAMKPEDYARPWRSAEVLTMKWIREGKHLFFCALLFERICSERRDLHEAASSVVRGLKRLEDAV